MTEAGLSCVQPAKGPVSPASAQAAVPARDQNTGEASKITARIGKPAPDFEASAFMEGGFKNVRLSDYRGKWVVLCFYPGDFTFV